MNDRMRDLTRASVYNTDDMDQIELNDVLDDAKDLENAEGGYKNGKLVPQDSLFVDSFYGEVSNVKTRIGNTEENTEKLRREYKKMESATQNEKKLKQYKDSAAKLEAEIRLELSQIKKSLTSMGDENKKLKSEKMNNTEVRIRENQHAALSEQFFQVMTIFNQVQLDHKDASKENLVRLVKVAVGDEMSEQEIERRVDKGEIHIENVFSQRLDAADGHTIKATYSQVKETYADLRRLELSMEELHEMFQDMHTLIQMQSGLLDSIEMNVEKSIAYVESGVENLKTAKKLSSKSRTAGCCFFAVLALVAAGLTLAVLIVLGGVLGGVLPKFLKG